MTRIDQVAAVLTAVFCWLSTVAQSAETLQRTLIIRQSEGGARPDVVRVCMQDGFAVVYHDDLDRYGNYVHAPAVFCLDTEGWWDPDKHSWVTKSDWNRELSAVKNFAADYVNKANDSEYKELLLWSLEPKYAIERDGKVIHFSSAWFKHTVMLGEDTTDDALNCFYRFRRLTLVRNSLDHQKGLPFIHTAILDELITTGQLPKRTESLVSIDAKKTSTWTEYEFRNATPKEISESTKILGDLPLRPSKNAEN